MAPASATSTIPPKATDSKSFINAEGQRQDFVIPPTQFKEMSPEQHLAALAKILADHGLPPKPPRPVRGILTEHLQLLLLLQLS